MHHLPSTGSVVRRPRRQASRVRIATTREVRPVSSHLISKLTILRSPRRLSARIKRAEYIFDIVRMKSPEQSSVILVARRSQVEAVPINRRTSRRNLRLQPSPRRISDKPVARQIPSRGQRLCIRTCWINRKKLLRLVAELFLRTRSKALRRKRSRGQQHLSAHLIRIPTRNQRNMSLLPRSIDVRNRVRQKISIHIRAESRRWWRR